MARDFATRATRHQGRHTFAGRRISLQSQTEELAPHTLRLLQDAPKTLKKEIRQEPAHGGAVAWLQSLELGQGFFSAVTFGEIQKGVELTRLQDPVKANEIEAWAAQLERSSHVLPMDATCFREYTRLMRRRSDTLGEDAMMAATARVHGLTVATRNERDFASFDVAVLNPFKYRAP